VFFGGQKNGKLKNSKELVVSAVFKSSKERERERRDREEEDNERNGMQSRVEWPERKRREPEVHGKTELIMKRKDKR
jgi:hypothetical protein